MKKVALILSFLLVGIVFFYSCNEEDINLQEVTIQVNMVTSDGSNVELNDTITNSEGRKMTFTNLKLYLSNIALNETIVKDVFLYDLKKKNNSFTVGVNLSEENEYFLSGIIGLDSILNISRPTDFPNEHPLSIEQNMHWPMLKYRFLLAEGLIDSSTTKNQEPNAFFTYHVGGDGMEETFEKSFEGNTLQLDIDVSNIFNNIDLIDQLTNHSGDAEEVADGNIIMQNLLDEVNE